MSHFSATLKNILHAQPKLTCEEWAAKFDIYPAHLVMMTNGGGALGHKVIAKISSHLSVVDREKLISAYFLDECASIEREASTLVNGKLDWNLARNLVAAPKTKIRKGTHREKSRRG